MRSVARMLGTCLMLGIPMTRRSLTPGLFIGLCLPMAVTPTKAFAEPAWRISGLTGGFIPLVFLILIMLSVNCLAVTLGIINSTDPEGDAITYDFQVSIEPDFSVITAEQTCVPRVILQFGLLIYRILQIIIGGLGLATLIRVRLIHRFGRLG